MPAQDPGIRIHDKEKTLCDCLRFRNQIGIDICLEALKNYVLLLDASMDKLARYADQCRVEESIRLWVLPGGHNMKRPTRDIVASVQQKWCRRRDLNPHGINSH